MAAQLHRNALRIIAKTPFCVSVMSTTGRLVPCSYHETERGAKKALANNPMAGATIRSTEIVLTSLHAR